MIHTYNEWDKLQEIVVGIADHANWPADDPVFANESEKPVGKKLLCLVVQCHNG